MSAATRMFIQLNQVSNASISQNHTATTVESATKVEEGGMLVLK